MTLEELCDCDADTLEKLTDEELTKLLMPYFTVTRPEMVQRKTVAKPEPQIYLSPQKKLALEMLREQGVEVDMLMRRKKK